MLYHQFLSCGCSKLFPFWGEVPYRKCPFERRIQDFTVEVWEVVNLQEIKAVVAVC